MKSLQLIQKGYDLSSTYKNRALTRAAIKDYKTAAIDISEAIKYSPGESELYYMRGTYFFKLGDLKQGCSDFKSAGLLGMHEINNWLKSSKGQICTGD